MQQNGSSKKEKGLMDMHNSVVIVGGEWGIRGLHGNEKSAKEIQQKNLKSKGLA